MHDVQLCLTVLNRHGVPSALLLPVTACTAHCTIWALPTDTRPQRAIQTSTEVQLVPVDARSPPVPCPVPSQHGCVFMGRTVSRFDCPHLKRAWEKGVTLLSHKTAWVSRSLPEVPGLYSRIWIVAMGTVSRHGPKTFSSPLCSETCSS